MKIFRRSTPWVVALLLVPVSLPAATEEDATMLLCDFTADCDVEWFNVDDGVMGGVSSSRLIPRGPSGASFVGRVSLENNGGFASLRGRMGRTDLSAHEGIALRVRGDGKTYGLRLRTEAAFDGLSYAASFETEQDRWQEIRIPFQRFVPTFRGRTIRGADPLDPSRIHQLGLIISDRQEGEFRLDLDWIAAYAPGDP